MDWVSNILSGFVGGFLGCIGTLIIGWFQIRILKRQIAVMKDQIEEARNEFNEQTEQQRVAERRIANAAMRKIREHLEDLIDDIQEICGEETLTEADFAFVKDSVSISSVSTMGADIETVSIISDKDLTDGLRSLKESARDFNRLCRRTSASETVSSADLEAVHADLKQIYCAAGLIHEKVAENLK